MGSRIAQGDTAARERIAIASALHVGGTSGEKSRPPVHRGWGQREEWEARRARSGTWEWRRFDLPNLVASESTAETLADPIPEFRKTIWESCSTNENHGRCLDALCAICRHRWRGGGSLNPPTCSRPGRIGRADVNSIASIAPTLAATLAYAATTRLVAFPTTSMVATDASLVHGAALH